jgi:hypothetical protein
MIQLIVQKLKRIINKMIVFVGKVKKFKNVNVLSMGVLGGNSNGSSSAGGSQGGGDERERKRKREDQEEGDKDIDID